MIPIGRAIYLWRQEKHLTQAEVAERSGISRPNLSAIEQGRRDLTVSTLRSLALALGITPGFLADCLLPAGEESRSTNHPKPAGKKSRAFTRFDLDRIARFVLGESLRLSSRKARIARLAKSFLKQKLALAGLSPFSRLPRTVHEERASWLRLKEELGSNYLNQLLNRINTLIQNRL